MKIRTNIEIGSQSKAAMIANRIPIPNTIMSFEMTPEKAHIFAHPNANYRILTVSEEEIYTEEFYIKPSDARIIYGDSIDSKDAQLSSYTSSFGKHIYLKNVLTPDIISGKLKDGVNIDEYLATIEIQIIENQDALNKQLELIKEFPLHEPQRIAAKAAYEAEELRIQDERRTKEKEEELIKAAESAKIAAEKEAKRQVRIAWAKEHGSDRLKKGLEQGYSCIKLYEQEYGAWLIGQSGYEYDRANVTETKDRSCPSLAALEEVEHVKIWDGVDACVVWLPEGLTELHKKPDEYEEPESGCEAVQVDVKGTAGYWYKTF